MNKKGLTTTILHQAYSRPDAHGALRMPIYTNSAFEFADTQSIEAAFRGQKQGHIYSRITNPTVEYLEQTIQAITGAVGVMALASGMAAISNAMTALLSAGDNVVTTSHLFGNTYSYFENTLKAFGVTFRYVDMTDTAAVEQAVDANTKAIFLETLTNPMLQVADLGKISGIARKHNLVLVADTTAVPFGLFCSKDFGIDVEIVSSTKYLSGGGTSVGGVIVDNGTFDWQKLPKLAPQYKLFGPMAYMTKLRKEIQRNLGACLSPQNAYLQTLGLETMKLRATYSTGSTLAIAQMLQKHPKIKQVFYPGLESSPYYTIAKQQFGQYTGSIVTFELQSQEACYAFLDRLELVRLATNLHDNKSLALPPATTIFCDYTPQKLQELGLTNAMVRLSVGIEETEDLQNDILAALETV